MILASLQARPALILSVLNYEHRIAGHLEQYKAIATLVDGSRLHINEVWLHGVRRKYAYYWLDIDANLIQGWDNAPHHPHIATYPHHSHTPAGVIKSHLGTLDDLLSELEQSLG